MHTKKPVSQAFKPIGKPVLLYTKKSFAVRRLFAFVEKFAYVKVFAGQQAVDTRGNYIVIAELTCFNQRAADGRRDEFLSPIVYDAAGNATRQIEDGFQGSADNGITLAGMRVEIAQRYWISRSPVSAWSVRFW